MANDLTTLAKRLRPLISNVTRSIVIQLVEGGLTGIHNHQEDAQGGKIDHGLGMIGASLLDDDHTQYLNETRHDTTTRHTLGAVVPHDSHSGLTGVSANQHHNQVHGIVSSDHTVTGAALDVVGLSAANTLGVLIPSSDVGATPAAALLKSTAAGGLTLGTLTVKGAVDITQDLTVGANVLLVDVSGNNVGIAGAPDPQFALDVNGPFHADVIYGPLGRLLKDCIFLAHYDGPLFSYDYGGSPQTVQGEIPTTNTGGVIYRPARFNKGVQAAWATVNKMTNPVFGHATWNNGWNVGADLSVVLNNNPTWLYAGYNSARVIRNTGGSSRVFYQNINVGNTNTHTLSAYVKRHDGAAVTASDLELYYNAPLITTYTHVGDGWYLLSATVTGIASLRVTGVAIKRTGTYFYIGGVQMEERDYPTPLAHGDMGQGHSWGGTPHESTTGRTQSNLIYTHTLDITGDFSIGFWVQPWLDKLENPTTNWAMCWTYNTANYLGVIYSTAGLLLRWAAAGVNTTVGTYTNVNRGQKYHVAIVKEGSTLTYYVDGEAIGSITPSDMEGMPATLGVGNYYTGANPINGLIDDFYVLERAQTQDDIKAIIDSDVPVASEFGATSWYSGGLAPIWVDGEGFWMRDKDGDPVFGWSSVNGKSWGGVTLDAGDNLIGRYGASLGGWQKWDRSAGKLVLGFDTTDAIQFYAGNAEITGKLKMPGTGSAIAIGSTPPTAANAGTGIWIDRTGLYSLNAGIYQTKINAENGKLYAGGGDVIIDSSGINIGLGTGTQNRIDLMDGSTARGMFYGYMPDTAHLLILHQANAVGMASPNQAIVRIESIGGTTGSKNPRLDVIGDQTIGEAIKLYAVDGTRILDGGLYVGSDLSAAAGDIALSGNLIKYKSSTEYTGFIFVPLLTPLTSTSWDGDARSTTAKTSLNPASTFGTPAAARALLLSITCRDSGSAVNDCFIILGPTSTADEGVPVSPFGLPNDKLQRAQVIVPCTTGGGMYYQILASGTLTFDVWIEVWGYYI